MTLFIRKNIKYILVQYILVYIQYIQYSTVLVYSICFNTLNIKIKSKQEQSIKKNSYSTYVTSKKNNIHIAMHYQTKTLYA